MPAIKHATAAKGATPQTLARRMLDESRGDLSQATEKLVNYVLGLSSTRLRDEILYIGARALVNALPPVERKAMLSTGTPRFANAPFRMNGAALAAQRRIRSVSGSMRNSLLALPFVIDGISKPLGEWTGTQMETYGETQLAAGATQVRNARFAIAVGRAAGSSVIGKALDDAAVERLHAEAMASEV